MAEMKVLGDEEACRTLAWRNAIVVRWTGPMLRDSVDRSVALVARQGTLHPGNLVIACVIESAAVRPAAFFYARDQFIEISPNVRAVGVCLPRHGVLSSILRGLASATTKAWRARWRWKVFAEEETMAAWAWPYVDAGIDERNQFERLFLDSPVDQVTHSAATRRAGR